MIVRVDVKATTIDASGTTVDAMRKVVDIHALGHDANDAKKVDIGRGRIVQAQKLDADEKKDSLLDGHVADL